MTFLLLVAFLVLLPAAAALFSRVTAEPEHDRILAGVSDPGVAGKNGLDWTVANSLNTARSNHTATSLPNGKVLVAGGYNGSVY